MHEAEKSVQASFEIWTIILLFSGEMADDSNDDELEKMYNVHYFDDFIGCRSRAWSAISS